MPVLLSGIWFLLFKQRNKNGIVLFCDSQSQSTDQKVIRVYSEIIELVLGIGSKMILIEKFFVLKLPFTVKKYFRCLWEIFFVPIWTKFQIKNCKLLGPQWGQITCFKLTLTKKYYVVITKERRVTGNISSRH